MTPSETTAAHRPSLTELFSAFVGVSLSGFGGALPWARRMIVDRKGWMTPDEFNEAFALSQFLPGPNVVNFSVVFGSRFGGAAGAFVALIGLMAPPVAIVMLLGLFYFYYGDVPAFGHALTGVAAAAVGLLVATVAKMTLPLFRSGAIIGPIVAAIAFIAIGLLQLPLPWVIAVLAPVSIAIAWVWP